MPKLSNNSRSKISNLKIEDNGISLMDLILIIARQLKLFIIIPLIFLFLMFTYAFFIVEPTFISTSKIMSSENNVSEAMGLAAQFGVNIPISQSKPKWAYTEIIKSRNFAKKILKRKFYSTKDKLEIALIDILISKHKSDIKDQNILESIAVGKFLKMVTLFDDKKNSILTINVSALDPFLAFKVNNAIIEELDQHQREYNQNKTSETRSFIEDRITETENELMVAEDKLKKFNDRNRRIENSPMLQLDRQRLSREVMVLTSVFTTLKQKLETTKIEEVKDSQYIIIVDSPEKPIKPSKPNKSLMILVAGLLGVFFSSFIILSIEFLRNSNKKDRKKIDQAKFLIKSNLNDLIPRWFK